MEHLLIIEDERPAFDKLHKYLGEYFTQGFTHDWAKSIAEASTYLEKSNNYSLIIADIQLGEENVFDLLLTQILKVPIIFCTAYSDFLGEAFQTNGIAYILKPYNREDLNKALGKYLLLFNKLNHTDDFIDRLREVFAIKRNFTTKFICKNAKNEMQIVESNDISVIEAEGDFCKLLTLEGRRFTYSEMIGKIESKIDPSHFFRINRSQVVNIKAIAKMTPYFKNRLVITLKGTDGKYITSSSRTSEFREWLEQ